MHDKDMPIPPRVGLMNTHYCLLCGAYLAGDHIKRCPVCGQAVKWGAKMSELRCLYCGKPLTGKQAKFCSRSCNDRYAYTRKPKKASKKPCKNCGKPTPDRRVSFCSAECRRAFYGDKPKPKRNVKPKPRQPGEQPCWTCAKAYGGCSWSLSFVPVEGWEAKPSKTHEDGYRIKMCPEYECDLEEYTRR